MLRLNWFGGCCRSGSGLDVYKRQVENDPTLRVARNEQTHQTIVTAMGEAQVETLLARMKEQAKVEARLVPVRIPYRETITKTAEAQGRHKKQTGGAGQFGDCWLRISPNPGEGYELSLIHIWLTSRW